MIDLTPLDPDDATARALAVPGVVTLFPVRVASRITQTFAAARAVQSRSVDRVDIDRTDGMTRIEARIHADAAVPAPDTARAVADALLMRFAEAEAEAEAEVSVCVRVAHIG